MLGRSSWMLQDSLMPQVMLFIGLTMATLAMAGRMWCSLFIAGRKNAVMVTQGPYALCRNPLYFFSLIGALGVGLATGMFTVTLAIGFAFALYYPSVIRREETYLHQRHGDSFTNYAQAVPCFWPRWSSSIDVFPARIQCHSRIFFDHLVSAIWFPIGCGVAHIISLFHSNRGAWPVWFELP